MTKKLTEVLGEVVDLLSPLSSEDRQRVIHAALTMLGETAPLKKEEAPKARFQADGEDVDLSAKAQLWMNQNGLSLEKLQQSFHLKPGEASLIAEPPGNNKKEKTLNAYILSGVANLLATGEATFSDDAARSVCINSGCYDISNHAAILKGKGNEFTGSKSTGWSLTAPGLKRAAVMLREMATGN